MIMNLRFWILDCGFRICDAVFYVLDSGLRISDFLNLDLIVWSLDVGFRSVVSGFDLL